MAVETENIWEHSGAVEMVRWPVFCEMMSRTCLGSWLGGVERWRHRSWEHRPRSTSGGCFILVELVSLETFKWSYSCKCLYVGLKSRRWSELKHKKTHWLMRTENHQSMERLNEWQVGLESWWLQTLRGRRGERHQHGAPKGCYRECQRKGVGREKKKYMQGIEPGVAGRLSYIRPKECRLDVESQILFVILVKVVLL